MRKSVLYIMSAVGALSAVAVFGLAGPANADSGDTAVTLDLSGGAVSISVPPSASLSGTIGTTPISGPLGTVTVTDNQGSSSPSWTTNVEMTNFNAPSGSGFSPIPVTNVTYNPGTVTRVNNTGTATPVTFTGESVAAPTVTATGGSGINSATWDPTLSVVIPPTAVATTYTATLTHSTVP